MRYWKSGKPMRTGNMLIPEDTQDKPLEPGSQATVVCPVTANGAFRLPRSSPVQCPVPRVTSRRRTGVSVFMRGLLKRLVTRIYFPDEPRNATDFVLNLVEPERRSTLIAKKTAGSPGIWNGMLFCKDRTKRYSST
jgi:protocatechuate 3,4-dioxygenase, alpha subunit